MIKLVFLMTMISSVCFSGAVKESLLEHEEAVYGYLHRQNIEVQQIKNSNYVKGKNSWLAISSDVLAKDLTTHQNLSLQCTSYFSINYQERSTHTEQVICTSIN